MNRQSLLGWQPRVLAQKRHDPIPAGPADAVAALPNGRTVSFGSTVRSLLGGALGNVIEWYDWFVYASFSLYFAHSFFPAADRTAALLNTSAIFAVGFLTRPLGAWLWGRAADRYGRKPTLIAAVLLMCIGSLLIAVVPGYSRIGIWAPVALAVGRMMQGLSVGGEYGVGVTYLVEWAPPTKRGIWASLHYVTIIIGQLLALSVLLLLRYAFLSDVEITTWAWRIPFAISGGLAAALYFIRRGMEEAPPFIVAQRARHTEDRKALLSTFRRRMLLVFAMAVGPNVAYYTFSSYVQKLLVVSAGFPVPQASLVCVLALIGFGVAQPIAGALSDAIGRKPLLLGFGVVGLMSTVPLLTAISNARSPAAALLFVACALLILSAATSAGTAAKAELFPAELRALGVGLPFALSISVFGGTAEYIALWLKAAGHGSYFGWYVTACIAVSLVAFLKIPETRWVHMGALFAR